MDLSTTDFSFFGSYMSLTCKKEDTESGLYLKSLHGVSKPRMESLRIIPIYRGVPEKDYKITASCVSLTLESEHGAIEITFSGSDRLVFHGKGADYGILFDTLPLYNFEYNYLLGSPKSPFCIVNSYKNLSHYLIYAPSGRIRLDQQIQIDAAGSCEAADNHSVIYVESDSQRQFYAVIRDIPTHSLLPDEACPDFPALLEKNQKAFSSFADAFPTPAGRYKEMLIPGAYVLWSATVNAQGNLKYPSVYASVNAFPGVWSWDHCFAALALNRGHHELAFQQMAVIFKCQDEQGQIPGSVSDSTIRWNFCKPPVHGYIFSLMLRDHDFSESELRQVYGWIGRQTKYYLKYKDSDKDGLCEYWHGNDSGQDNSTVFSRQVPVESPDLAAYLIKAMELLETLAIRLGEPAAAKEWRRKAERMTGLFLHAFLKDGLPVPREAFTKKEIRTRSLLPFISLILGKRLPKESRQKMISVLKQDFLTEWGLATEAPDSPCYQEDAYWRGAVWAPVTLLFFEALRDCGEHLLARDIADKFCRMVQLHGFSENFNAKTGEGLRDHSFSWTAAVFLYLSGKLNNPETP